MAINSTFLAHVKALIIWFCSWFRKRMDSISHFNDFMVFVFDFFLAQGIIFSPAPLRGPYFLVPLTSTLAPHLHGSVKVMQNCILKWKQTFTLRWLFSSLVTRWIHLEESCSFSPMPELRHWTELQLTSVAIYPEWEEKLLYYNQVRF